MIPLVVAIVWLWFEIGLRIRRDLSHTVLFVKRSSMKEEKKKHIQIEIHDVNGFKCKVWFHFRLCLLILVLFEIVI